MPIYEYQCQKCGSHFEVRQGVSDDPLKLCQKCGGMLEKQWSLSGFQFKGEGWYVTDYASKKGGPTDAASGEKGEKSSGDAGEKSSGGESTTTTDAASKSKSDAKSTAKADLAKKKD